MTFGLWDHWAEGHEFLDDVNRAADANKLTVFAVGGNHENWDHWEWYCANMPTSHRFAMVRRRVLLSPKVNYWKWAGKQFRIAGGAVSVDKEDRLQRERGGYTDWTGRKIHGSGPHTQWWPGEQLTDDEEALVKSWGKTDYLFTHDCSDFTNFTNRLKPDQDSVLHRQRIDRVLAAVKPEMHFHGHMHDKYEWKNKRSHGLRETAFGRDESEWNGHSTWTYGLECNWDKWSWGVLDVEKSEFTWGPHVKIPE